MFSERKRNTESDRESCDNAVCEDSKRVVRLGTICLFNGLLNWYTRTASLLSWLGLYMISILNQDKETEKAENRKEKEESKRRK